MRLRIEFLSFWRTGSGKGLAGRVDLRTARDADGLPYVPGRHLRGILREAVREAEGYHWFEPSEARLFGTRDISPGGAGAKGTLRVDSARMLATDRAALADLDESMCLAAKEHLFAQRRSTAIDRATGGALQHSLRVEEVAIPLLLEARITKAGTGDDWRETIKAALPLIRAMGADRSRGLGRCRITPTDVGSGEAANV